MSHVLIRRYAIAVGAVVVLGLLVLATFATADNVDQNALSGARAVGPLPSGQLAAVQTPKTCKLAADSTDGAELRIAGPCTGVLAGVAACSPGDNALTASVQSPVTGGRMLTVTVIVPDYPDAGVHDDADLFVQVSRTGGAQRWSARGTDVTVADDGGLALSSTLVPDPGTQTTGTLKVVGHLSCPAGDDSG